MSALVSSSTTRAARAVAVSAIVLAWGCDDPLKEVELVDAPRPLAARVEVEGEPGRAAPLPGERASVRFLLAAPDPALLIGFRLGACVARENNLGVPGCAGPAFAMNERLEPAAVEPLLEFEVPRDIDALATPRLAVLGAVCAGGAPEGPFDDARCSDELAGDSVSLELELARPDDVNRNPELAAEPLSFDGEPWPELEAPPEGEPCAGFGLVEPRAGSGEHAVGIAVREDARDPVPRAIDSDPEREELRITHVSTDGGFARPFSSLAADDPENQVVVPWVAPPSAEQSGQLVRLWFVVRDLRGGSAWTSRALCVVP